jgi:hypothetical protein
MAKITKFKLEISQAEVERLQRKLQDTRLPEREIVPDAGSDYGSYKVSYRKGISALC